MLIALKTPSCPSLIIASFLSTLASSVASVVQLLKPFVGYVLLFPFSSPELALVGKYLHSELISIARNLHKHGRADLHSPEVAIMWLLVELLPLQPSQSDHQLLAVVSMVESLVEFTHECFQGSPEISGEWAAGSI